MLRVFEVGAQHVSLREPSDASDTFSQVGFDDLKEPGDRGVLRSGAAPRSVFGSDPKDREEGQDNKDNVVLEKELELLCCCDLVVFAIEIDIIIIPLELRHVVLLSLITLLDSPYVIHPILLPVVHKQARQHFLFHILQVQLRVVDEAAGLELELCNVEDLIDRYTANFLTLYQVLPMNDLEIVLDIEKELMSSNLHLLIFHTVLALFLVGLLTGSQAATIITEAAVRTFLAAFVLQTVLKKPISNDIRISA